jgi:glucose-6-phosphate 1-dehydrogenase
MTAPRSDALVFFGATGDLAYRKIFPALQALVRRGHLDMPVIGVAKPAWDVGQLEARARDSLKNHGGLDPAAFAALRSRLRYVAGDYRDPATYDRLRDALGGARRPLHYLAIPPSLFATVSKGLAKSGCARDARVVVEKPFGRDLASARQLNSTLHASFPEEAIFRIDHYLGKEPVQSIIYFRFANPLIDVGWDNRHIESVQITMAEGFGVEGRGRFYDEVGAIRDVVQNHMLMVAACLGMEPPTGRGHDRVRDERRRLLRAVRTLIPEDVVRGQYRGYRQEPGVNPESRVETFAAVRLHVDNDRWAGVPFLVRVGKRLPVTATEVLVWYRRPQQPVLDETDPPLTNYYRFRLGPEVVVALGTKVKKPGELLVGERIELIAHHQPPDAMAPYERLLGDALQGDAELFAREDAVEESWRVVDPVLGDVTPLYEYEPGTWGPPEADRLLVPEGSWHNPKPTEVSG